MSHWFFHALLFSLDMEYSMLNCLCYYAQDRKVFGWSLIFYWPLSWRLISHLAILQTFWAEKLFIYLLIYWGRKQRCRKGKTRWNEITAVQPVRTARLCFAHDPWVMTQMPFKQPMKIFLNDSWSLISTASLYTHSCSYSFLFMWEYDASCASLWSNQTQKESCLTTAVQLLSVAR